MFDSFTNQVICASKNELMW